MDGSRGKRAAHWVSWCTPPCPLVGTRARSLLLACCHLCPSPSAPCPCPCPCPGFLDFYIDAAMTRPEAAWKDLFTMGYDKKDWDRIQAIK